MRRVGKAMTLIIAALMAGTALADAQELAPVPSTEQLAAMNDAQVNAGLEEALESKEGSAFMRQCRVAAFGEELRRRDPGQVKVLGITIAHGFCALSRDDWPQVIVRFTQAEELAGTDIAPETRQYFDEVILDAAVRNADSATFETHAGHISDRNWPQEFAKLDPEFWRWAMFQISPDSAGRIAFDFVESSSYGYLPEKLQTSFAFRAVRPAISGGKLDKATELALRSSSPYSVLGMLIDRDYAAIWPQLEAAAGPKLAKLRLAQLDKAKEAARSDPGNMEKHQELVSALLENGDAAGAVAAAARVDHNPANAEKLTETEGWILDTEVRALNKLGRRAEADAIMAMLGALSPDPDRSWVVNFAINRADRLVQQGRWKEALPAAERAVAVAAQHGSPYAKEVAAVDRYCAAIKLDPRRTELPGWWTTIEANFKDNIGAAIQAAQCKGDVAAARRLIRLGLIDPKTRPSLLRELQPRAFDLFRDSDNMFAEPRLLLVGDPKLQTLFLKYGRELPANLMPN